jgi:hypothetical protein
VDALVPAAVFRVLIRMSRQALRLPPPQYSWSRPPFTVCPSTARMSLST